MIRPIAFCAGLALAWCAGAEAADLSDDAKAMATRVAKVAMDELAVTNDPAVAELIKKITAALPPPKQATEAAKDRLNHIDIEQRLDRIEGWIRCRQQVGSQTPC